MPREELAQLTCSVAILFLQAINCFALYLDFSFFLLFLFFLFRTHWRYDLPRTVMFHGFGQHTYFLRRQLPAQQPASTDMPKRQRLTS